MNKPYRLIKRRLALILVLLFSIESFAAVVGDNDGAAFITKAEFDSMKNDFQSQLDRYNSSLDNKIDGAIASYLSGIGVQKQTELKILVDNYQDIFWMNKWKWFGRWREWSDYDSYTENTTDGWYEPVLNDNRLPFRTHYLNDPDEQLFKIYSDISSEGMYYVAYALKITGFEGNAHFGNRNSSSYMEVWGNLVPPVSAIRLEQGSDGFWYEDTGSPYRHVWRVDDSVTVQKHGRINSSWSDDYLIREHSIWLDTTKTNPLSFETPPTGSAYSAVLKLGADYTTSNTYFNHTDRPAMKDLDFPVCGGHSWCGNQASRDALQYMYRTQMTDWARDMCSGFEDNKVRYNDLQPASCVVQRDTFLKMLFGSDQNEMANIAYISQTSNAGAFDFSAATKSCTVKGQVLYAGVAQPLYYDTVSAHHSGQNYNPYPSVVNVTLSFPLWPQLALKNINSRYFKFNGQPLKKGQGIPLLVNNMTNGILYITANYTTNRIVSTYTSTGIEVDIAKGPFTDTTRTYCDGWVGSPDAELPKSQMRNFAINNAEKKIQLSIPVRAEEDIWLRVKPANADGGYYAKLSNLKLTLVSNS